MSLNITSKQTTIKLGPHKGEEMYVMNVFVKPRAEAKFALTMPRRENDCCEETKVNHYSTLGSEKIIEYASETRNIPKAVLRASWEALDNVWQIVNDYISAKRRRKASLFLAETGSLYNFAAKNIIIIWQL